MTPRCDACSQWRVRRAADAEFRGSGDCMVRSGVWFASEYCSEFQPIEPGFLTVVPDAKMPVDEIHFIAADGQLLYIQKIAKP